MQKLIIPTLNGSNSIKELTVNALGEEWPLTVKQLYSNVSKISPKSVSYQAVHKGLQELETAEIVKRIGNAYEINTNWLGRVEQYAKELKKSYEKHKGDKITKKGEHVFKTLHECEQFLVEYLFIDSAKNNPPGQPPLVCTQWAHFWVPLFLNQKTYLMLKETAPLVDVYSTTYSNTWLDKWCHEFWKKHFLRTKIGVKQANNRIDIAVFGDNVVQIFHPEHLRKEINEFYEKTKSFNQFKLNEFFEQVFEQKTQIPVTITQNPILAEQIKKETMGWFKK